MVPGFGLLKEVLRSTIICMDITLVANSDLGSFAAEAYYQYSLGKQTRNQSDDSILYLENIPYLSGMLTLTDNPGMTLLFPIVG